jgi:hypothetical protein
MYGIYANIGGILMVNVTIYTIHGSYGHEHPIQTEPGLLNPPFLPPEPHPPSRRSPSPSTPVTFPGKVAGNGCDVHIYIYTCDRHV